MNIFNLNTNIDDAEVILLPVPWETTVSYRKGTSKGPKAILQASSQVDMYDRDFPLSNNNFYMLPIDETIYNLSGHLQRGHNYGSISLDVVNDGCQKMVDFVYEQTKKYIHTKKIGLVGGDHSTPLGYIKALSEIHHTFGILQIDSHCDLREDYNGLKYSHASIMHNVLKIKEVQKLVQVGVRDCCKYEIDVIKNSNGRIKTFFDEDIKAKMYHGDSWGEVCREIVDSLPYLVYISFDIDGLDPKLCPDTGTPVPGGFDMQQIFYLLGMLQRSGKKIIGFDLNEVSNGIHQEDTINSITGSRVLYKLCNLLCNTEK